MENIYMKYTDIFKSNSNNNFNSFFILPPKKEI